MTSQTQVAVLAPLGRESYHARESARARDRPLVRLAGFAALGLYGVLRWATLMKPAPTGRLLGLLALAVALATAQLQTVRSQSPSSHLRPSMPKDVTCVVYPLAGLGHDPSLPQWVAETIPSVVDPGSWGDAGGTITFHAASKVLVVRHTPAVHAKVKAFLADLKSAAHEEKGTVQLRTPPVMPAAPASA